MRADAKRTLPDYRAPPQIKIALLWTALMFLYIYNDYFSLYLSGTIERMAAGQIGPGWQATDMVLAALSAVMAAPALMIFLSVGLPAPASRWLNVFLGLAYTAIEILTFFGSALFYQMVVGLEIILTLLIVWYALRWPKQRSAE